MKIERDKFYRSRNGKKTRIICTDSTAGTYPVLGIFTTDGGEDRINWYQLDGESYDSHDAYDLISEWGEPEAVKLCK